MTKRYGRASAITPHDTNTIDPVPEAVYVGSGNFTDSVSAANFYNPSVWFRSEEFQTPTSAGALTEWEMYQGVGVNSDRTAPTSDSMASVNVVDGDASTNLQNYVSWTANNSHITSNDDAAFNIGTGEFEMMAVVRFDDNGDLYQHIASRNKGATNWSWLRRSDAHPGSAAGKLVFAVASSDPISDTVVPYGTWFILGVSRNSSNEIQLYRDGATDGAAVTNAADLDADADDNLILGAITSDDGLGPTLTQSLRGGMLEFVLWETSLSTAERAAVVQSLQDRYFNKHRAQLKITDQDGSQPDLKVGIGEVVEIKPSIIHTSHTYAGDIVGLRKD